MSQDSEIVAVKCLGLNMWHLTIPSILLGIIISLMSAQVSFRLNPWANRQKTNLITQMTSTKPSAAIRAGVFSEGFYDLVVYANRVDEKTGILRDLFIFNEREFGTPLTIVAAEGQLLTEQKDIAQSAFLRLSNGDLHRNDAESYTKVNFETYDLNLFNKSAVDEYRIRPDTLFAREIREKLQDPTLDPALRAELKIDLNRRISMAIICLVYSVLGVGLGTVTNRRNARAGGMVIVISVIVIYWILEAGLGTLAKKETIPIWLASYGSLIFFSIGALFSLRSSAQK